MVYIYSISITFCYKVKLIYIYLPVNCVSMKFALIFQKCLSQIMVKHICVFWGVFWRMNRFFDK